MLISTDWAAVKWRFTYEATQKGSKVKEEWESSLWAYLVFRALDKQEAIAFWSCVGNTKLFRSFTLLLMLQPYLSSPGGTTELGFVFTMPRDAWSKAARLPLALEELTATSHLQGLAAGLPCKTARVSTWASRWLHALMKSVVLFMHCQKGEGWFVCEFWLMIWKQMVLVGLHMMQYHRFWRTQISSSVSADLQMQALIICRFMRIHNPCM